MFADIRNFVAQRTALVMTMLPYQCAPHYCEDRGAGPWGGDFPTVDHVGAPTSDGAFTG